MLTAGVASLESKANASLIATLAQTGLVQSVVEFDLLPEQYPTAENSVPDVILVEIGRDPGLPLAFAAHVHRIRPSVCLIACSTLHLPSPELLMQAMRSGVREFLTSPVDPLALRETLDRLIKEHKLGQGTVERLTLVLGTKGGVGTTTVAVNLGVQLSRLTQKRVALLDFARPLGHAALLLDLQTRFSIRDAQESLERLDSHFFGGLLTTHRSGLLVLPGSSHPDEWQTASPTALTRILNVAQSSCDFVVADLGTFYTSEWEPVLRLARLIVLVAETNVPALWSMERHLSALRALGLDPEKLRLVINRWHRTDDEALKTFEKKVNRPISVRLPNDFRQVSQAINLGTELSKNHNDPLVSRLRSLASEIAGHKPEPEEKRSSILGLFPSSKK